MYSIDEENQGPATPALMLQRVGEVLYPGDPDFHIQLAHKLGIKTKFVKSWLSGKTKSLTKSHEVFDHLEQLLLQRETEATQARIELEKREALLRQARTDLAKWRAQA
jgi:hypothetical protein